MPWGRIIRRVILLSVGTMVVSTLYVISGGLDSQNPSDANAVDKNIRLNVVEPLSDSEDAILERHRQRRKTCKLMSRDSAFQMDVGFWSPHPNEYSLTIIDGHAPRCLSSIGLLVLVPSAPSGEERRTRIRTTWADPKSYQNGVIKVIFVIGSTDSIEIQSKISREVQLYEDILQLDFEDNYQNLTLKSILGLQWVVTQCSNAKYVAKIDDDTSMARLGDLLNYVHRVAEAEIGVLCGAINVGTAVARESGYRLGKWRTTFEQYPDVCYPPYCDGCAGYVMSVGTARRLHVTSQTTRMFWLEDVYVGGILPYISGNVIVAQMPKTADGQFIENTCALRT